MNISKDKLVELRQKLESEYNKLEKEITKLYSPKDNEKEIIKKQKVQLIIDEQIDLIDNIIRDLDRVPRLYDSLLKKNEQYNQIVGE